MRDDPIMADLRRTREQIMEECGGDPHALHRLIKAVETEAALNGWPVVALPPRPSSDHAPEAA